MLEVAVHQLVGQHRQRQVVREVAVFILLQDLLGKLVQIDGKAVVGLHGGDVHRVSLDVGTLQVGHV